MPNGLYAQQSDAENQFGVDNIAEWSQLDNDLSTADEVRIQAAFNVTDAYIISQFYNFGNYATPLQPLGSDIYLVTRWSAVLVGEWLYFSRGMRDLSKDAGDLTGNHIKPLADQVREEMTRYRGNDKLNAARRWPTSNSPVGVSTTGFA
jgi:hypothetical protein